MSPLERIWRDIVFLDGLARTLYAYRHLKPTGKRTLADDLEASVDKHRDNLAFRFEDASLTYAAFEARANAYAHWALAQGLKRGDTVALFMGNKPDYVACWFGLSKVGVITALINSNLMGAPLAHCLAISNAAHVIVEHALIAAYEAVAPTLAQALTLWDDEGALEDALGAMPATRPPASLRAGLKITDPALLVYTSGTTGAPKAAKITHLRAMGMLRAFGGAGHASARDRVYLTLPL
ncbi:MAG: AMP-binding protein, partial [Hyphomonadaceae bacterium]